MSYMKSKLFKNIILSVFLIGLLSSCLHSTEPEVIIEYYAENYGPMSGNVLAYKNMNNETIVLKSGNYINNINGDLENTKETHVISLAEILDCVAGINYSRKVTYTLKEETLKCFLNACIANNSSWYSSIKQKTDGTLYTKEAITDRYREIKGQNLTGVFEPIHLQALLGVFRHTELQIQALLYIYNKTKIEYKSNRNTFIKEKLAKIGSLLPATLTIEGNKGCIYSLFEACNCCRNTNWLQGKKDIFMFKILDSQFDSDHKYKMRKGFMSQLRFEQESGRGRKQKDQMLGAFDIISRRRE